MLSFLTPPPCPTVCPSSIKAYWRCGWVGYSLLCMWVKWAQTCRIRRRWRFQISRFGIFDSMQNDTWEQIWEYKLHCPLYVWTQLSWEMSSLQSVYVKVFKENGGWQPLQVWLNFSKVCVDEIYCNIMKYYAEQKGIANVDTHPLKQTVLSIPHFLTDRLQGNKTGLEREAGRIL